MKVEKEQVRNWDEKTVVAAAAAGKEKGGGRETRDAKEGGEYKMCQGRHKSLCEHQPIPL